MKCFKWSAFALITLLILCLSSNAHAQIGIESYYIEGDLTGKQSVTVSLGMKLNSGSTSGVSDGKVVSDANFIGLFRYRYWFDKEWSINASAGYFSAKSDLSFTQIESISIIPLLFGFSYYPEALAIGKVGRSYVGLNTGIYMGVGSRTSVSISSVESKTVQETVFGIEPHAGIDFYLSNRFSLGPSFSYHVISEFDEVVGDRRNYSDPVFSVNFSIMF